MPTTIAICDDEKNTRENIMRLVKSQCEDCFIELYDSGDALLAAGKEYDLYFLDIQMPGINGLKTAERIRERQKAELRAESVIIFITALREYMESAFDVKAFHYLVKPVNEVKFAAVFSRALNDCRNEKCNAEKHIIIKSGNIHHKIFLKDIFYVESRNNKVVVNGTDGAKEYYATLREAEATLGDTFFRCHRCYLVNMRHIKRYNANTVWLKNGAEILLAKKKYPQFVKAYMAYTKSGGLAHG